ncbi:MAG TPA: SIS domain-containing protein [Anaerolineales bacterium]|nr:SIS domain-containing protein [Anaerolineales bacterium]
MNSNTPKSQLLSEIYQQPEAIRHMLDCEAERVASISQQLSGRIFSYALIAARGTSDNAARYGQYILGAINHLSVALAAPSLFTRYHTPPRLEGALIIGISQSGQSPDIVSVIDEGRQQGAPTIAITNDLDSPLARSAEYQIGLGVGEECSIAATKTYTAQLTAIAMLALGLKGTPIDLSPLQFLPQALEQGLLSEPDARLAARELAACDHTVFIGRGFNYSTAWEIALKCKELANIQAEPMSSADFLHGPIAMVDEGFPVNLISIGDTFRQEFNSLAKTLHERGARLITIGDIPIGEHMARQDRFIPVPVGIPEWLSPICAILPGQLLAYHLTKARGFDPDQPRLTHKVTLTK